MIDSIAIKKKKIHLFIIKWQLSQNVLSERQSIACFITYHYNNVRIRPCNTVESKSVSTSSAQYELMY